MRKKNTAFCEMLLLSFVLFRIRRLEGFFFAAFLVSFSFLNLRLHSGTANEYVQTCLDDLISTAARNERGLFVMAMCKGLDPGLGKSIGNEDHGLNSGGLFVYILLYLNVIHPPYLVGRLYS